jgi:hypothetical protein
MLVWLKSVSNEGHFTLKPGSFSCLTPYCSGVNETSHLALTANAVQAVQVSLQSVSNEGDFTRDAYRYLTSHSNLVAGTSNAAHKGHGLQALQVRLNSVNNGGKLLLNPKLFIVPISRHIAAG